MKFKNATQSDLDSFMAYALSCDEILPYLSVNKYTKPRKVREDDWEGLHLTDDRLSFMLHIDFDRSSGLRFTIALYAKNSFSAGKALLILYEMIKRYKPYCMDATVAISNIKSFAITEKIFGKPWGLEPMGCWNMLKGEFEDCYYFRKIF